MTLDQKVINHLVITCGFSRRNAEIAIQMFRAGELNKSEEEVINRIMLNPESDSQPMVFYKNSCPVVWTANHLNYKISMKEES